MTRNPNVVINRLLPAFEFVIRTSRAVRENSHLLENYLRDQPRPRGFVIQDPRLTGQVFGSTFSLRQRNAWMWTSAPPIIEGAFVPNEQGSDVVVQIVQTRFSLIIVAVLIAFLFISLFIEGLSQQSLVFFALALLICSLVLLLPVLMIGRQTLRTLSKVFLAAV